MTSNFNPFATLVAEGISSKEVYVRLAPDLPRSQERSDFIRKLRSHALENTLYTFSSLTATWLVCPRGKTATGRYIWDLYIRPVDIVAA